jgi:hypothetical protein
MQANPPSVGGPVFEEDEPRVKNLRMNEFKAHAWVAGIGRLPARGAQDHGKNHEPESVDESKLHHALHETDAGIPITAGNIIVSDS